MTACRSGSSKTRPFPSCPDPDFFTVQVGLSPNLSFRRIIMSKRTLAACVLALTVIVQAGCSSAPPEPEASPVKGAVSQDGKPVADAQVWFTPEKGPTSYGKTDSQGHYDLTVTVGEKKGAVVGKHQVRVVIGAPETASGGTTNTEVTIPVAKKTVEYAMTDPISVEAKENQIDLDLKNATKR